MAAGAHFAQALVVNGVISTVLWITLERGGGKESALIAKDDEEVCQKGIGMQSVNSCR